MTAEVAVLNKHAVALAADSAVTLGIGREQKVYNSVNKLFSLSKVEPVGVMVYGNADLLGVPWETLVKLFRRSLRSDHFPKLSDYANAFIDFLDNGNACFPDGAQEAYFQRLCDDIFTGVKHAFVNEVSEGLQHGALSLDQLRDIASSVVEQTSNSVADLPRLSHLPQGFDAELNERYDHVIEQVRAETLEELPLTEEAEGILRLLPGRLFVSDTVEFFSDRHSGLVIAGYGDQDIFPAYQVVTVDGLVGDRLRYTVEPEVNINDDRPAVVRSFAQGEMVHTFMEGVHPDYDVALRAALNSALEIYGGEIVDGLTGLTGEQRRDVVESIAGRNEQILEALIGGLQRYRHQNYAGPVVDTVAALPKDELAEMAEALVNLTSFRRRVSMDVESVGGPVDVAVISRGDGLVWIRRKHYFDSTLNPHFVANYFRELDSTVGGAG